MQSRRPRYYVDVAASTPACNSNSWALEQRGWNGLCIEANPGDASKLRRHRRCHVAEAAIDSEPRNATFLLLGGYGGLLGEEMDNTHTNLRGKEEETATMITRRLVDVLTEYRAPAIIDYLSLDVEGAESRVLSVDALANFTFLTMTIERPPPELCRRLFDYGYLFVQNVEFDAHFVHSTHPRAAELSHNASFEQVPAKCTSSRPHRLRKLYAKKFGDYPYRCSGTGYFTVKNVHMCCEYRGHSWRTTRYGPPTSRWVPAEAISSPTAAGGARRKSKQSPSAGPVEVK